MKLQELIKSWFDKWEKGDFLDLPIAEHFEHSSPFGTIKGKKKYMQMVKANAYKFLGYRFNIHDAIYDQDKACVRYTAIQGDFTLDVSEWYYIKNDQIEKIIAYYHIGEIREDRRLTNP